jgi:hypothetical protein
MASTRISVERVCFESAKSMEEVLMGLEKGIGRPNLGALQPKLNAAASFAEFQELIHGVVGSADLISATGFGRSVAQGSLQQRLIKLCGSLRGIR